MNGLTTWWSNHRPTKRRLVQLYSALLYNANLKGFVNGQIYTGKTKALCVPGFNCYSCPGATGACPLGSLQASLAASDKQPGFYVLGILLLYGVIEGRTICGWACPMGLIQELLYKIPTPKIKKNRITRALSYLKYVFLVIFAVAVTLWYGLKHSMAVPGFCKYICPAGTLEGAMGLLSNPNNSHYFGMLGILFTRKFIIMLIIGALCIFCYRSFCRFICPLGAIYGMFNRLSIIGVKVDMGKCNGCGLCVRSCKMDVRRVGDHECIHCGKCMEGCAQGAISIKAGKYTLSAKEDKKNRSDVVKDPDVLRRKRTEKVIWILAAALLVFALLWYNVIDNNGTGNDKVKDTTSQEKVTDKTDIISGDIKTDAVDDENTVEEDFSQRYASDAPKGHDVGDRLEDFTAICIDGSTFRLSDQKGKVVVINLWATWCGPCVQELPHFYEFYHEHGDDVAVLTCHSRYGEHDDVNEDVREFLKDKIWDTPVAVDDDDNGIFEKTGGSMTLPQTIVLNRKGEVIYNEIRSITPQMLEKLYEKAAMGEAPGEYKKYLNGESEPAGTEDNTEDIEEAGEEAKEEDSKTEEAGETEEETDNKEEAAKAEDKTGETENEAENTEEAIEEADDSDETPEEADSTDEAAEEEELSDVESADTKDDKDKAVPGVSADIGYDATNNRVTISGDYVKSFIDKTGIRTKEDFMRYLKEYMKNKR